MTPTRVVVTGDVTMDWNLARTPRAEIGTTAGVPTAFDSIVAYCQPGGAALLGQLLGCIAEQMNGGGAPVVKVSEPRDFWTEVPPSKGAFHHSFALWQRSDFRDGARGDFRPWRCERPLGVDPRAIEGLPGVDGVPRDSSDPTADWVAAQIDPLPADLLVIDDANFGFRRRTGAEMGRVPASIADPSSHEYPWVLLKMARPVARGDLWQTLLQRPDRLIVVVAIDDLRGSEAQVSRGLSWERTAQDLMWELAYNPLVNALSRCAYVVVSFDTDGAIAIRPTPDANGEGAPQPFEGRLFFDPACLEGDWSPRHPGGMVGFTSTLVASLARALMLHLVAPKHASLDAALDHGVLHGLAAIRALQRNGYVRVVPNPDPKDAAHPEVLRWEDERRPEIPGEHRRPLLGYPAPDVIDELAKAEAREGDELRETEFRVLDAIHPPPNWLRRPRPTARDPWTILRARYPEDQNFDAVARAIAREDIEHVLADVPRGEFGKLVSVDRQEVEGYHSIGSLVAEYSERTDHPRPLSIAVFGPPGSGKSFGIVQVVKSVLPHDIDKPLTFNLSQLHDPSDLLSAFHQIRDKGLEGQVPLVFWDEFDTTLHGQELGWLRYFLAPMQDGTFQEGSTTHAIGPAIFVFAGGTCSRMQDFEKLVRDAAKTAPGVEDGRASTDGSAPRSTVPTEGDDFALRRAQALRMSKGVDFVSRLKGFVNVLGPNPRTDGQPDPYFRIRRAILLRSMLRRDHPQLFHQVREARRKPREVLSIDPGVLRAFIHTRIYKHGARSIESIVAMSELGGKPSFERSALPAQDQLGLHVDPDDFLDLVRQLELPEELVDPLAEQAHVSYCALMLERAREEKKRLEWGAETYEYLERHDELREFAGKVPLRGEGDETHATLVPFDQLDEHDKEQNRGNVRDIPSKLAVANYAMRPLTGSETPSGTVIGDDVMALLAEMEHDRWMRAKLEAGFRYGKERNNQTREHPDIRPWKAATHEELVEKFGDEFAKRIGTESLTGDEREKDFAFARGIPEILRAAGYTIVKFPDD